MKMIPQDRLRFGTAGIPLSTPDRNTLNGIPYVKQLGLGCMELEFVRNVNITEVKAPQIKQIAKENDVMLTCHGQYYINLNSLEQDKIIASQFRIYNAAKIASLCGAYSMTFHAAFYNKMESNKVTKIMINNLKPTINRLKDEGHDSIWIRPETTGKSSQWGTVPEIIEVAKEIDCVLPCIDFSHMHARSNGNENSYQEYSSTLALIEKELGRTALNNMHIHVSGIAYTKAGESHHLNLPESDLKYEELMKAFNDFKIKGCVISESPNIEGDAVLMKKTYDEL